MPEVLIYIMQVTIYLSPSPIKGVLMRALNRYTLSLRGRLLPQPREILGD